VLLVLDEFAEALAHSLVAEDGVEAQRLLPEGLVILRGTDARPRAAEQGGNRHAPK
jgi:hypothetical protein